MPLPFLLAFRFLRSSGQEKTISVMLKICFFSILIGTCALTLVAAIMNGFEQATYKKLQGIHADITINAYDQAIDYEKLKKVIEEEYADTIAAVSPTSIHQVIIQNSSQEHPQYTICLLKAIDPKQEQKTSNLPSMITKRVSSQVSQHKYLTNLGTTTIMLGEALAEQLHLTTGDTVTLLYPDQGILNHKITLEEKEVRIEALFKTGIHDFDEHVIICSFELARQLYPTPVSQVTLMLKDPHQEQMVIESLRKRLSLTVLSWKELYPSLVSALILEKYAMIGILLLVTLVASLNIISLLFMYVVQKRKEIAILKTLGMADGSLISIFLIISALITLSATGCGIILAYALTALLNHYPFIQLPDVYYVSHLPAALNGRILCAIALLALLVSIIAAYIPARKIKNMVISHVLKNIA